jgi:hypothetical protein
MLSAEEIKPLLLHEDRPVRDAAADYLRDSWCQDTALVPGHGTGADGPSRLPPVRSGRERTRVDGL